MKDKKNLKKGQAFIGVDDEKYYFLGYDYDNQIMFTNIDWWTDKEQKYAVKNNLFIKEVLDDSSELIEHTAWYYESLDELNNSSIDEQLLRCLDIIDSMNTKEMTLEPCRIGPLVRGQAYSKERNQFYELIGFIVENIVYVDKKYVSKEKGFFSIYHSNCDETVPLVFERGYENKDNSFDGKCYIAGNDDIVNVVEILLQRDIVNSRLNGDLRKRFNDEKMYDRNL